MIKPTAPTKPIVSQTKTMDIVIVSYPVEYMVTRPVSRRDCSGPVGDPVGQRIRVEATGGTRSRILTLVAARLYLSREERER